MSRRRLWVRRWVLMALVAVALGGLIYRHLWDYVFPDKFLVVEPGRLYRGAWQYDSPMRNLVRDYKIKTIVALAHPPDDPKAIAEAKLARELGVRWVHIPIVEESTSTGERRTVADALERAAAVLADPASQPVYFHCHHGLNRTSLVQIAYRTLHCGWTLEQAEDEIARTPFGLIEEKPGVIDYRSMAAFYRERVLPRRQARAATNPSARR